MLALLLAAALVAQDTTLKRISSDTITVPADSVLRDSTPITQTRLDTVGWDYAYDRTPARDSVTDLWEFIIVTLLGEVPPPGGGDSVPPIDGIGGADLQLDFNDPNDLGVTCAGMSLGSSQCPNFPGSKWRKHSYLPTGGVNGTGAINMHWQPGMSEQFSPIWITVPLVRHFRVRYAVRQNAPMVHSGSRIKVHRFRADQKFVGTLLSKQGEFSWFWEGWHGNTVSDKVLGVDLPTDNQWHTYEIEVDYRDINDLVFSFWLDGQLVRSMRWSSTQGDILAGRTELTFSPFAEMYSCGGGGCGIINTGDFTVDNFTYTVLP